MAANVDQKPDGTISIAITTTPDEGVGAKTQALKKFAPYINATGFRSGKAPLNIVEQNTRTNKLLEETLSLLAGKHYQALLDEEKIHPITQPRVNVPDLPKQADDEQKLKQFLNQILTKGIKLEITTYTTPEITLGNWQRKIQDIPAEPKIEVAKSLSEANKKATKEKASKQKQTEETQKRVNGGKNQHQDQARELENKILDKLSETIKFDLAPGLIEIEAQNQLYQQIQLVQNLGIDFKDYLKSQNKSTQDIEKEVRADAEKTLKIRFILGKIALERAKELPEKANGRDVMEYLKKIAADQITG